MAEVAGRITPSITCRRPHKKRRRSRRQHYLACLVHATLDSRREAPEPRVPARKHQDAERTAWPTFSTAAEKRAMSSALTVRVSPTWNWVPGTILT